MRGKVRDVRYAILSDSTGSGRLYETGYEDQRSILRATEMAARCEVTHSAHWAAGSTYTIPIDEFHSSNAESPSVTIVEAGTPSGRPPLVVGTADGPPVVTYERRALTGAELAGVLADVAPR